MLPAVHAKAMPVIPMTHDQRKRLWWQAQRMSFAASRVAPSIKCARRAYCQFVYRILIRHPEEYLR